MDEMVGGSGNALETALAPHTSSEAAVARALRTTGACVMPPADVTECLGTDTAGWARFASHWEQLAPDPYAAERGTRRLRRYGQYTLTPAGGEIRRLPHIPFVQPENSNPLYVGVDRQFEPLTEAFADDPLLRSLLGLLGRVAATLEDAAVWKANVHPFRVLAQAGGEGQPTPEGRHRDGVTLVTSLLVSRRNAAGGESAVHTPDGSPVLTTTLREPGTLLLGDDRRTLHGVSPIRPHDSSGPASRDVLVVTCTPC